MGLFADAVGALLKNPLPPVAGGTPAAAPAPSAPATAPSAAPVAASGRDQAFADVIVFAVASKGELSDNDCDAVAEALAELPAYQSANDDQLGKLVDGSLDRLEKNGWDKVLASLGQSIPVDNDRKQAYALAVAVQYSADQAEDDDSADSEDQFLNQLASAFQFSDQVAQGIIDQVEKQLGLGDEAQAKA